MKTLYLIKSCFPFAFLPIAPSVMQVELQRSGLIAPGSGLMFAILLQVILSVVLIAAVARAAKRNEQQSFLRMSCVSKKVLHKGEWVSVERYLADHHNVTVSHGMTPDEAANWLRESREWVRRREAELEAETETETAKLAA